MLSRLNRFLFNFAPAMPAQKVIPGSLVPTVPSAIASYETTSKNTEPSGKVEVATFAHGCFWGTQEVFDKYFGATRGVKTTVGYTGGEEKFKNPTYRQVCSGTTGFAEACKVEYDPTLVGYAELVEFFYRTHDPTTPNRQGNDRGTQYRSAIFTHSPEQTEIARKVTEEVQEKHFTSKGLKIVSAIDDAGSWYDAETYHQKYLEENPDGYHCSTHVLHW